MDARAPFAESDVLLAGGGLVNSLIALAIKRTRPELSVILLEREPERPDAHTWCVFESDLAPHAWAALEPYFANVWPGYDVAFPRHGRRLSGRYARLTSAGLAEAVEAALGDGVRRDRAVVDVGPDAVRCADGEIYRARLGIDGRGARPSPNLQVAYQKFIGLELVLKRPHGLTAPVVMDATVRQEDGYRFLYVLPLAPDVLLVEDTRYSDHPALDRPALETAVLRYARARGWMVAQVRRREAGVLPVALSGDIEAFWNEAPRDTPQVGMRGAFFHPTTGYSTPDAAAVADLVAAYAEASSAEVAAVLRAQSQALWRERSFYRLLNRMLFHAAAPEARYRVFERFYTLPEPLIRRFYAGRTTLADKARILSGRPPVPLVRAVAAMFHHPEPVHA